MVFDDFVVSKSNRLAFYAVKRIAEAPEDFGQPLLIIGESGLGKTHLLYAVKSSIETSHPDLNITYVTTEQIINEIVVSLITKTTDNVYEKYKAFDLLLIDNFQEIIGKSVTSNEIFQMLTYLNPVTQVVIAATCEPGEITGLPDMVKVVVIDKPDKTLRTDVLRREAHQLGITLTDNIIMKLADGLTQNISQLKGAVLAIDNGENNIENIISRFK